MFDTKGCKARASQKSISVRGKTNVSQPSKDTNVKLAIVTIYSGDQMKRGLCALLRSACWNNVSLHVLRADRWSGLGQKIEMTSAFLDRLGTDESTTWIVMFVDSYDSLIQVSHEEIKHRFLESGYQVIISSENNCFPWQYPFLNLNAAICSLFEQGSKRYPNSGGLIGEAKALRHVMSEVKRIPQDMVLHWPGTDQGLMGQLYLMHRFPGFVVDTESEFWATLNPPLLPAQGDGLWASGPELGVSDEDEVIHAKPRPPGAVLHFPGGNTECFRAVEATAWYNRNRSENAEVGTGVCPNDRKLATFIYEYDSAQGKLYAPSTEYAWYEKKCTGFRCDCSGCECSPDGRSIRHPPGPLPEHDRRRCTRGPAP